MVQVARADLDLDLVAFGSDARGMQRLVAVRFLVGDVVVELAGYRLVDVMRDTERAIGIIDLVDDHAKAKQVGNLQQLEFLRSEEHTSELQSLMRISYAVFCLQKKIKL